MTHSTVALYGGSFDPPHLGHVLSVAWALSATEIDAVWVIPTWKHAFGKQHGAAFDERVAMCALAFAPFRNVTVSTVEQARGGVSHTLETIQALRDDYPEVSFRLLVGSDVLPTTPRWHRWEDIVQAAPPIVVGRDGYPAPPNCPVSIPNINSTEIRRLVESRSAVDGMVPSDVIQHVRDHGLYLDGSHTGR
ncbi:MAG: nicotinate (nicotinamide) nucleotide adenylyltransferase [Polyangiales bacterium]